MRSIGVSSLKVWKNLAVNPLGPGLYFVGRLFITVSISLHVIGLFRYLISFWFNLSWLYASRNYPFHVGFPVYLNISFKVLSK
jgi:hypothetical protein